MVNAKTFSLKTADVTREWYIIDASDAPMGRVATQIANLLIGKSKPTYTPHIDGGDYVVVINAAQTVVTGAKETDKVYYSHSGFPGALKERTVKEVRGRTPERLIEAAVKGMLPKNKLASDRMNRLKVFPGAEHAHTAQTPKKVEMK
jgi:large subunit ribosomal protein L13